VPILDSQAQTAVKYLTAYSLRKNQSIAGLATRQPAQDVGRLLASDPRDDFRGRTFGGGAKTLDAPPVYSIVVPYVLNVSYV